MTKANKLSMVRLLLVPFYILFLIIDWNYKINIFNHGFEIKNIISLILLLIILITDYFDGVVARKYNEITIAGKLIDPTIDKLVTLLGFLIFLKYKELSFIAYCIILFREIFILGLRLLIVSSKGPAEAKMLGKIKTALSFVLLCFLTLDYKLLVIQNIDYNNIIFWIVSILTLFSGIQYVIKAWPLIKNKF